VPYLVVDPLGLYPVEMVRFLGRLGREAIAIFTSEDRCRIFRASLADELGAAVVDEYLVPEHRDLPALARVIAGDWPDGIEGIIPWDELSLELGAALGELLGVGWNPTYVIERFRDKARMKAWLREHAAVRVNASRLVADRDAALAFQRELGSWPVVVKPSAGSGATAVYFAESPGELLGACQRVREAGLGEVLLEEYVGGREYVVNGIADAAQRLLVTDVWIYDKRESHGVPNLYHQTVKVSTTDPVFAPLAEYAGEVVEALGLRRAPVHMELKLDSRGPCLIEVGARLAGGNQPLLASQLHGRSLFELAACHYLAPLPVRGDDLDYARYDRFAARIVSGVQAVAIPAITRVVGLDEVEALPSFAGVGFVRPPGRHLSVTRDLATKSYEIYLLHEDEEVVAGDARTVRAVLRYE
jgi:biotin carboxylase